MNFGRKTITAALMTGSMALRCARRCRRITGAGSTRTPPPTRARSATCGPRARTAHSFQNEDPAHEATESAAREARKTQARSQRSRSTKGGWAL